MNYGYAGTKELNEALVSRFMVINMPKQDEEIEAAKREASVEEYRKYNGLRDLKNLAILLGEDPESLDSIA